MKKKITLRTIIESVIDDNGGGSVSRESDIRGLSRKFFKLIEKLGSDKEVLKQENNHFEFDESEVPFMKVIISQLYNDKGIIARFTNDRKQNGGYSSDDVHELIQSLINEADKEGFNENEQYEMALFFNMLFLFSQKRSLEFCHELIDNLYANLCDYTIDEQSIYLGKVEHILKKEVALRIAESAIRMTILTSEIESLKGKDIGDGLGNQVYYEEDPEIRFFYMERDNRVLEAIQEDDDLRQYIEKKFGKKAEDIFNYGIKMPLSR